MSSYLVLAAFIAAYGLLLLAVRTAEQNRGRKHARVLSLPRVYGPRFEPQHARPDGPVKAVAAPEMGLAA